MLPPVSFNTSTETGSRSADRGGERRGKEEGGKMLTARDQQTWANYEKKMKIADREDVELEKTGRGRVTDK